MSLIALGRLFGFMCCIFWHFLVFAAGPLSAAPERGDCMSFSSRSGMRSTQGDPSLEETQRCSRTAAEMSRGSSKLSACPRPSGVFKLQQGLPHRLKAHIS